MTEKFVASNGWYLENGHLHTPMGTKMFSSIGMDCLREIFQHERDRELGRWRWPENPDYVVYHGNSDSDAVWVHNEREAGAIQSSARNSGDAGETDYFAAARAYFAAHPEPKPLPSEPHTAWVDKYGTDIWWVDGLGVLRCCASPSSNPAKYAPFTQLIKGASHE